MNHNFVHLEYPLTHPGVDRAEKVVSNFKRLSDTFSPTRTLAVMLLAAVVAAFIVVADQMIDTWAEGHLLAAWVALWAVAFAAVGLFAGVSKTVAIQLKSGLDRCAANMAQRHSDERLWAIAQTDARRLLAGEDALDPEIQAHAAAIRELSNKGRVFQLADADDRHPLAGPGARAHSLALLHP